jgi:hypothetical protein
MYLLLECLLFLPVQELLAIQLAVATFSSELSGRRVVLYGDNVGAEHSTQRGRAKALDHNQVVHNTWTLAFRHKIHLWIERVPSAENISDSPSRGDHALLYELGAQWCPPSWS